MSAVKVTNSNQGEITLYQTVNRTITVQMLQRGCWQWKLLTQTKVHVGTKRKEEKYNQTLEVKRSTGGHLIIGRTQLSDVVSFRADLRNLNTVSSAAWKIKATQEKLSNTTNNKHFNKCFHVTHVGSLWQDLSVRTKKFDLLTLTLTFDLLLKKLNLGYNFWTKRDKAFILQVYNSLWQDLSVRTKKFDLVTLTLTLGLLLKKLNLGYNLWTKRDKAFILQVCIPCGKTFLLETNFFTWPWLLTYFWKNLTLTITFEPKVIGL